MPDFIFLREEMVRRQMELRGIRDKKLLTAFRNVPRHKFVPGRLQDYAYEDCPLEIGEGQTISQPYIVALMTEILGLKGGEKILEIGTGSGYQSAILSELAKEIYSIERIENLAKRANETLKELGYTRVNINIADGTLGWQENAPFDRIIITAAAAEIPSPLIEQLTVGGRLVAPVGNRLSQILTILDKGKDRIKTHSAGGCVFVPLIGEYGYNNIF